MSTQKNIMYDKEQAIHKIGEEHWERFEEFMLKKKAEFDKETGFQVYHPQHVSDFIQQYLSK